MKKLLFFILTIAIISNIGGCSDRLDDAVSLENFQHPVFDNDSHFVTLTDVLNLTKVLSPTTRSTNGTGSNIICYEDVEHDTLLYISENIGGGWTIYSSDTRVPAIIAKSDTGSFAHASKNKALMTWVSTIAEDMKLIKHACDAELNFTTEEIASNKKFWKSISSPDEFVKEIINENAKRNNLRGIITPEPIFEKYGHYEQYVVEQYIDTAQYVPRLTQTNWHQYSPYNFYCPHTIHYLTPDTPAPAGCVAIAGAQMLYFLHYSLGVPDSAPSLAYCISTINDYPNYVWNQYGFNSTIWNSMNSSGMSAAPLVAHIGKLVDTEYGNNESSGSTYFLATVGFDAYGISCDYSNFIDSINAVDSNLVHNMPIIVRATASGSNSNSHSFIVDRYLKKRDATKTTFTWVYDSFPSNPDGSPMILPGMIHHEYTIYSPYVTTIGMNWGWGSTLNNVDEWFALTGNWLKDGDNYSNNRYMIHNFRIKSE